MNIYGFYHIACLNHWKDVFDDQIIKTNKINFDKVYISVIYNNNEDLEYINNNITYKFEIVKTSSNVYDYEFGILKYMWDKAQNEDFLCFYFHTKGVSICDETKTFYFGCEDLNHLLKSVNAWREYMEYFLFEKQQDNIKYLENYDAVGVSLSSAPTLHFSGNFWWSKSSYIKKLTNVSNLPLHNRYAAEYWIGNNNKGNLFPICRIPSSYLRVINKNEYA